MIVLRRSFFAVFAVQASLALLVGMALPRLAPGAGGASVAADGASVAAGGGMLGAMSLTVSALHLPLGWVLGSRAIRAGGRRTALSGTVTAAVLLSIPAWFTMLLLASGQPSSYVFGSAAVVALACSLGLPIARLAARCATAIEPEPGSGAGPGRAHEPAAEAARAPALEPAAEAATERDLPAAREAAGTKPANSRAGREERLP
jgi:hypothetical protein